MMKEQHSCPLFKDNGGSLNNGNLSCGSCINYRKDETAIGCNIHEELKRIIRGAK